MRVVRWCVAALAWVLAVAVVAGVAWFAIDSAGREVGAAGPVTVVPAGNVVTAPTGAPGRPGTVPASPSATAVTTAREVPGSPSASPSGQRPVPPPGVPAASRSQVPAQAPTPSRPGRPSIPAPATPTPPNGPTIGRNGTYSSVAGDLTARCLGRWIEGWGVRPADGWRVDAAPAPRGALVVVFTADDGRVIEVEATCRDGLPVFRATPPG